MSYLQFIITFDLILVSIIVLFVISVYINQYLYDRKHRNDKPITKEEFEKLRQDRTSIFYLADDLR